MLQLMFETEFDEVHNAKIFVLRIQPTKKFAVVQNFDVIHHSQRLLLWEHFFAHHSAHFSTPRRSFAQKIIGAPYHWLILVVVWVNFH